MLPRKRRLNQGREINQVLARGRRVVGRYVIVRYRPIAANETTRVGFIVSKRVHNKPTVRNLIKRRMRHILSPLLARPRRVAMDYLFTARSQATQASYRELESDIREMLTRAGLL